MSGLLPDYKGRALEKRLSQLLEEYEAVTAQRSRVLSAVDDLRLERQAEALEQEIEQVQAQLDGSSKRQSYDLAVVRELLLAAFTAADLRRVFLYTSHADLRSLGQQFSPGDGLADMADKTIQYCVNRELLSDLLAEVERANPRMYARYAPQLLVPVTKPPAKQPAPAAPAPVSVEPPKPAPEQSADYTILRLQLLQSGRGKMHVRGLNVPGGGQPKEIVSLPFPLDDLPAVLKALDEGKYVEAKFKPEYKASLERLGLLVDGRLLPEFHAVVGRKLYDALFAGDILTELRVAERMKKPVACQICFDPEGVILAQYPWELLYDGSLHRVVVRKGMELTRYITFDSPPTPLRTKLPLRILFISPRPKEESHLQSQLDAILAGLEPLRASGQVTWQQLNPPTWEAFEECLFDDAFDVIHFDGHGSFARECPACGLAHFPTTITCSNPRCQADMSRATPEGYLHFEDDDGHLDPLDPDEMKVVLSGSETRLMLLSACGTCVVKGTSVFNGLAPALIQAGIPAVVAMQASPPDASSVRFVQRFYESLAKGNRLPTAANDGRLAIYRPRKGEPISWFMPVVYLRESDGTYGQLFDIMV